MTKLTKTHISDEELVERIISLKKHEEFGILYDRYSEKVYHKCISFVHDLDLAQDLAHDVFLKTFLSLSKFNFKSRFSTWLYSITYNFCVDYVRKHNKVRFESDDDLPDVPDNEDERNQEELLKIEAQRLQTVLDTIPVNQKMILLMKYQDEMSIADMMNALEANESAVKMRIKRARANAMETYKKLFTDVG